MVTQLVIAAELMGPVAAGRFDDLVMKRVKLLKGSVPT